MSKDAMKAQNFDVEAAIDRDARTESRALKPD
jgi:hypothetical protein